MGIAINMVCKQCKNKFYLSFGCGFAMTYNDVVFLCKRCGYWVQSKEKTEFGHSQDRIEEFERKLEKIKQGIFKEEKAEKKNYVICPKCKIRMGKINKIEYDDYGKFTGPKITCNECGGLVEGTDILCWD